LEPGYEIAAHGDSALLVTFGDRISPAINARVHAAATAVRAARGAGAPWSVPTPAYASLLVGYDPVSLDFGAALTQLRRLLESVAATDDPSASAETIEITVRYGGEHGPDLAAVAERCGLAPAQVIEAHASVVYRAYMLGFAPGFAYLGELPAELELPRRDTPRQRVPAGSVAIAGRQTAVYPSSTPGGWHLIGWTDAVMWDARRSRPALIEPANAVRFVPSA
jgi:KipI family sensor histidine kinase inhibitor